MITIELARKLRDSGFPQNMNTVHYISKTDDEGEPILSFGGCLPDPSEAEAIALPTLSELIEACGDGFKGLLPPNFPLMELTNKWGAIVDIGWIIPLKKDSTPYSKTKYKDWYFYVGSTPEEAVALLWLELNKK